MMFGWLRKKPKYLVRIMKMTGDGEQSEISFNAETEPELTKSMIAATGALDARMKHNNQLVLETNEKERQRIDALKAQGANVHSLGKPH